MIQELRNAEITRGVHCHHVQDIPSLLSTTSTCALNGAPPSHDSPVRCACECIPPTHSTRPSIISEPRTSKKDSRTKKEHARPPPMRRTGRRSIRSVEAARISAAYFWMITRTRLRLHRGAAGQIEAAKGKSTRSMRLSISSRPLSPDPFGR